MGGGKGKGGKREGVGFLLSNIKYHIYQNKPKRAERKWKKKKQGGKGGGVWGKDRRLIIEIVNELRQI